MVPPIPTEDNPICVNFISLGCAKNLVDSERMLGILGLDGMALVPPDEPTDVTVINTCGFIQDARDESFGHIRQALQHKKTGLTRFIVIAGCLAQSWKAKLLDEFPQIDAVIGLNERDAIAGIIRELLANADSGNRKLFVSSAVFDQVASDQERLRLTDPCWAYLRISEGCDQRCTFCTIPSIRGPFRSKPLESILAEAHELVADGVRELNLIGQETSSYGTDLGQTDGLAALLTHLDQIKELKWIRIFYMHPASVTLSQIQAIKTCKKVAPYLDLPLQHISDRILKLMHRKIDRTGTIELLNTFRREIPNMTIRTTMLVGFPSETEEEFNEMLQFVKEFQFDMLGAFMYSAETDTPAARISPQVPAGIIESRYATLMAAQQEIAFARAQEMIGKIIPCLIIDSLDNQQTRELGLPGKKHWYLGRHIGQGPEVDPVTYLEAPGRAQWHPGQIIPIRITGCQGYDLTAKPA